MTHDPQEDRSAAAMRAFQEQQQRIQAEQDRAARELAERQSRTPQPSVHARSESTIDDTQPIPVVRNRSGFFQKWRRLEVPQAVQFSLIGAFVVGGILWLLSSSWLTIAGYLAVHAVVMLIITKAAAFWSQRALRRQQRSQQEWQDASRRDGSPATDDPPDPAADDQSGTEDQPESGLQAAPGDEDDDEDWDEEIDEEADIQYADKSTVLPWREPPTKGRPQPLGPRKGWNSFAARLYQKVAAVGILFWLALLIALAFLGWLTAALVVGTFVLSVVLTVLVEFFWAGPYVEKAYFRDNMLKPWKLEIKWPIKEKQKVSDRRMWLIAHAHSGGTKYIRSISRDSPVHLFLKVRKVFPLWLLTFCLTLFGLFFYGLLPESAQPARWALVGVAFVASLPFAAGTLYYFVEWWFWQWVHTDEWVWRLRVVPLWLSALVKDDYDPHPFSKIVSITTVVPKWGKWLRYGTIKMEGVSTGNAAYPSTALRADGKRSDNIEDDTLSIFYLRDYQPDSDDLRAEHNRNEEEVRAELSKANRIARLAAREDRKHNRAMVKASLKSAKSQAAAAEASNRTNRLLEESNDLARQQIALSTKQ